MLTVMCSTSTRGLNRGEGGSTDYYELELLRVRYNVTTHHNTTPMRPLETTFRTATFRQAIDFALKDKSDQELQSDAKFPFPLCIFVDNLQI